MQGFHSDDSPEARGVLSITSAPLCDDDENNCLVLDYTGVVTGRVGRASTPTFLPPDALKMPGYGLFASPTLYSGQTVRAEVSTHHVNNDPVTCRLYVSHYDANNKPVRLYGPEAVLEPGDHHTFTWQVPDTHSYPIFDRIRDRLRASRPWDFLCELSHLGRHAGRDLTATEGGTFWRKAWVNGVDHFDGWSAEPFRLIQDEGTGLIIQGTREWTDYRVSATITPHMVASTGLAARVQGMRRYYALLLQRDNKALLVKALDGLHILAEAEFPWQFGGAYSFDLQVEGDRILGALDGKVLFDVRDTERPLTGGAVALVCEVGRMKCDAVRVQPVR